MQKLEGKVANALGMNDAQIDQFVGGALPGIPLGRAGTADEIARRRCSSPPTTAATSPAQSCSSMAASRRSDRLDDDVLTLLRSEPPPTEMKCEPNTATAGR
jgi:hypothetical protein